MIVLDSTRKVTFKLSGAITTNQLEFVSAYADASNSAFTEGFSAGPSNNTTDVDLVVAPSSGQRLIKTIWIHNKDTVTAIVTVEVDVGGTKRRICKLTLRADETLEISEAGIRVVSPVTTSQIYAEGTFTPKIIGDTGTLGAYAASTEIGRYTRIGNRVFYNLFIGLTSKGSWTGNAFIDALPFTANNIASDYHCVAFSYFHSITLSASKFTVGGIINPNQSKIQLMEFQSGAAAASLPMANIANGSAIGAMGIFEVS
jgi:hypothetical protein